MTDRLHFHFKLEVRFGVISIFFFMFFYIFQNVLKCIQFKIKFRFMCFFFKVIIMMASIYLEFTIYWNYLSYLLLLTNWILKTVLWNRDPPYPHLQLGIIILPKRHREKVTCPGVQLHDGRVWIQVLAVRPRVHALDCYTQEQSSSNCGQWPNLAHSPLL